MAAAISDPDRRARRNVLVLVLAQAVLGSQMPIFFILGGLSGQMLAANKCFATLPISLIVVGSMLTAPVLSQFMQRYGRKAGFFAGAAGGGLGAAICALALYRGSFALFLAGSLLAGIYMSAQAFYRFAATDTASEVFRAKAISWVMAGGLLSAVIGPQLVKLAQGALAPLPFAGAYLAIIALNVAGVWLFLFLDLPKPAATAPGAANGRTRLQLLRTPQIAVAMICAMVSYALMNLMMTSAPLAVVGCGFTTNRAADVVSVHVLAMFAPSFVTGHLINRFGAERIVSAGLVILAGAGLVALAGIELANFFIALALLGVGWNFGYIGATSLLTAAHAPAERGRVQGMNDFSVFGLVTVASLASGGLMNCSGGSPVEGWAAVNYAMIPFLALAGGALIWLAVSGRKGRAAALPVTAEAAEDQAGAATKL
ncbi:MAG: MFS transporter [Paracoccaceae bacterium]